MLFNDLWTQEPQKASSWSILGIRETIPASGLKMIWHCRYVLTSNKAIEWLGEIAVSNSHGCLPIAALRLRNIAGLLPVPFTREGLGIPKTRAAENVENLNTRAEEGVALEEIKGETGLSQRGGKSFSDVPKESKATQLMKSLL